MRKERIGRFSAVAVMTFFAAALVLNPSFSRADEHLEPRDLTGKSVAIVAGEGLHDGETLFPMGFLLNRGAEITVVGVESGYVKAYNSDTWVFVERSVDEVSVDDFDAIVIPGGRSPANLREHQNVVNFVRGAVEGEKIVAAICHGPQLLIAAGVMEGRAATCFPNMAEEIIEAGSEYDDVPMIRDGNIITSRVPDDLSEFVAAIEQALSE